MNPPRICICMATFNPNERLLRRQIESIRSQTNTDWVCLVQDDASYAGGLGVLQNLIADDARFLLQQNETNLGFYRNFERLLIRVPAGCEFISLADQDDDWYAHKLATLAAAMDASDATLAYADMRVIDVAGNVLSDTFWSHRRNQCSDLESLFFTNTVTGAAAMFRASLLPAILPFPTPGRSSYHDWWIALVALAAGSIHYVDQPLHDYCQHYANAVGWRHNARTLSLPRLLSSVAYRQEMRRTATAIFNDDCQFLAQAIDMLCTRVPHSQHAPAMQRLHGLLTNPVRTMLKQYLRALLRPGTKSKRERNILLAHALCKITAPPLKAPRRTNPRYAGGARKSDG